MFVLLPDHRIISRTGYRCMGSLISTKNREFEDVGGVDFLTLSGIRLGVLFGKGN